MVSKKYIFKANLLKEIKNNYPSVKEIHDNKILGKEKFNFLIKRIILIQI